MEPGVAAAGRHTPGSSAKAWCSESYKPMTKTNNLSIEVVRDAKHAFRAMEDRPKKPQKHRYERRKVREILKIGDWAAEEAAA